VEWVETTGRTVQEAKEAALDELGVDETDAEFDVVAEPGAGLFGRLRSEARVRARVRPTAPRAKDDRRDRKRRDRTNSASADAGARPTDSSPAEPAEPSSSPVATSTDADSSDTTSAEDRPASDRKRTTSAPQNGRREGTYTDVPLDEQGEVGQAFLRQLVDEFGLAAEVTITHPNDETVDLHVDGSDLGLLIGPKGATLLAIQDLTRTVVHHRTGANNGRLHVDVGGYRQRRAEALARFAVQVATTVRQSGVRTALEPMSAADRKVVHDAITEVDGVSTISEGEDPNRRVIVLPAVP
jgi:spoIIIJ-associated protein